MTTIIKNIFKQKTSEQANMVEQAKKAEQEAKAKEEEEYLNKYRPEEDKKSLSVQPFSEGKDKGRFYDKNSKELQVLSHYFDVRFRIFEKMNLLFITIATAGAITAATGFTVATAGVGAAPILLFVAFLPSIGRCAQLWPAQWYKSSELQYICSACLSMVTNMQDDLIKLKKFYKIVNILKEDKNINIEKTLEDQKHSFNEYEQPHGLYTPVEKNLYKFLFLLLNAIDFNTPNGKMTELQEFFLIQLFNYCDFDKPRYDIKTDDNGFVTSSELSEEEKLSRRNGKFIFRYTHQFCRFNPNPTDIQDGFKESNISKSLYNNNKNARICNNYNDVIVRMLHEKFLNAETVLNIILKKEKSDSTLSNKIIKFLGISKPNNNVTNKLKQAASKRFNTFVSGIIDSPTQKYREMLREYVIMTGNWSMIISKYSIQYNEFILLVGDDTYKKVLIEIDSKTAESEKDLDELVEQVINDDDYTINTDILSDDSRSISSNSDPNTSHGVSTPGGRPPTKRRYKRKNETKKHTKNHKNKNKTKNRK